MRHILLVLLTLFLLPLTALGQQKAPLQAEWDKAFVNITATDTGTKPPAPSAASQHSLKSNFLSLNFLSLLGAGPGMQFLGAVFGNQW
jgi:hypothetical protein